MDITWHQLYNQLTMCTRMCTVIHITSTTPTRFDICLALSSGITEGLCQFSRLCSHSYIKTQSHSTPQDQQSFTVVSVQFFVHISCVHSSVICQTIGPQSVPKRFLHLMRSRASSFKWEYSLLSPRSFSNCLRLLPRLLVTSIRPFIFPSITSFRRPFLRKIWPSQLYWLYHRYKICTNGRCRK
jgi:hypothetical protein